jgi:hypothetical protein
MADPIKTPTTPSTGGVESSTLSSYAGPYVTNMLGKTEALANAPYQTYQGPLTAGESGLQSKVFQGLGSLNFPGQLGQTFSASQAPTIGSDGQPSGGGGIASQYMNPYLQSVLGPQLAELQRQSKIQQMQNAGTATKMGAFGSSGQTLMDTESQRNALNEMNKAIGTGYSNAYDKALGQFNVEQGQSKTLADMMSKAGEEQRGIEQQGVTADLNEFLQQRDYPQKMLQLQQSMLQGLPISTVATTPNQQSGLGSLTSSIGGLGNLMESLKSLGINLGGKP